MGEEDLIREYVDRNGFSSDTKFVLDELNKIWAAYQQLDKFKLSLDKNSGLAQVTILAKQAGEEFTKLNTSTERLAESTKKQASANNQLNSSQKDLLELSARNSIATKQLTDERKKLEAAYKSGAVTLDQYTKELADIKDKQTALSVSSQQVNTALKNIEKEAQAAEGSLEQLRAQLNLATQAFDKMSASEKASSTGRELFNKINSLTQVISAEEQATGRFQRNVGNYVGSAKIIVDALERSRTKVIEVGRAFGQTSPEAAAARKEFEALDRLTGDPQFLNVASKFGDTNKELKFFQKQLNQLEDAGLKNSQVYTDVQQRLAKLTDQLGDTRAEIKALSSDTRSFDLFAGSVSFAADTFQAAAGAAVLFGASEEDAAKATKVLIAVQSVANGVKGIATELTTKGTAANILYAKVQGIVAVATDSSAKATVRLAAAGKLLLGAGLIGLIGYLVVKFGQFNKTMSDTERQSKLLSAVNKDLAQSAGQEIAKLDVLRKVIENTNIPIKERKKAVDEIQDQYPEYFKNIKDEILLQGKAKSAYDATKDAILETAKTRAIENKLAELSSKELEALQKKEDLKTEQRENEQRKKRADAIKAKNKDDKEARGLEQFAAIAEGTDLVSSLDDVNKDLEKIAKDREFLLDQIKKPDVKKPGKGDSGKDAKQAADKELQVQFNLLKLGLQQIVDFNKEIVDDETKTAEQRLIALQKYYIAKNQIVDAQANLDKALGKKTSSEILLIDRQRADERLRISREVVDKSAEIQKNGIAAGLQLSKDEKDHLDKLGEDFLKKVKERTDKEIEEAKRALDAKKEVADKERELIKQLYDELTQTVTTFLTAGIEKQKNKIQEEIDALDEKKAKEIEVANQTIANEQDKAAAIAVIEARTAAQKEALEKKKRQLDQQAAKFEKAAQIIKILGDTATAEVEALKYLGNPATAAAYPVIAALIGAIGAAQLARVIATPIPKYAEGKNVNDAYGGPAIVGDGGKRELIIRENGAMELTGSKPELTYVRPKDIILPDAAMALNMGMASMGRQHDNILSGSSVGGDGRLSFDTVNSTLNKGFSMLNRTIQNKKENHFPKPKLSDIVNRTIDGNKEYFERNGFTNW
jgi:DNA repair exonuclease SbcCD ATPase subunit